MTFPRSLLNRFTPTKGRSATTTGANRPPSLTFPMATMLVFIFIFFFFCDDDDVHSQNFDDGAVVHRRPLFDASKSTRETNTTPRRTLLRRRQRDAEQHLLLLLSSLSLSLSRLLVYSLFVFFSVVLSFFLNRKRLPKRRTTPS